MKLVTIETEKANLLRDGTKEVSFPLDKETKKFIAALREFFYELRSPYGKPAGLAGPQVGNSSRIIIIQIPPEAKLLRKDVQDELPPTVLINPSFEPIQEDLSLDWEGCFSVPRKMGEVRRYQAIHYKAFTQEGEQVDGIARGFLARLLQHEIGHLNGQLYTDLLEKGCRFGEMDEMMEIRKKER